jgi:hypothetical protein
VNLYLVFDDHYRIHDGSRTVWRLCVVHIICKVAEFYVNSEEANTISANLQFGLHAASMHPDNLQRSICSSRTRNKAILQIISTTHGDIIITVRQLRQTIAIAHECMQETAIRLDQTENYANE